MKIATLPLAAAAALLLAAAPSASAADHVRGQVIVGYDLGLELTPACRSRQRRPHRGRREAPGGRATRAHPPGRDRRRRDLTAAPRPGVTYAVPNYVAHAAGFVPNDPGRAPGGWQGLQWNFSAETGVNAPAAWEHA